MQTQGHTYTPEQRVLINAVRIYFGDQVELVTQGVDWGRVFQTAKRHGVEQVLYRVLSEREIDVPSETLEALRNRSQAVSRKNLQHTHKLLELVDVLNEHDIDAVPYRGPVLAEVAYKDIALRSFGDLDLLVRREAIPAIESLLVERGYDMLHWRPSTQGLTSIQKDAYTRFCRDYPFRNEDGITVELHWKLLSRHFPTRVTLDTVWDRRDTVSLGGRDVPTLSPEDRLFMLCIHGSRHNWERLEWVVDVAAFLHHHSVDWRVVRRLSREHHSQRMFVLGLLLAHDLFGAELPEYAERFTNKDPKIKDLRAKHHELLFDPTFPKGHEIHRSQARLLDRPQDRLRFWFRWAFNPDRPGIESVSLPDPRLYRLVRVVRLVALLGRRVVPARKPAAE